MTFKIDESVKRGIEETNKQHPTNRENSPKEFQPKCPTCGSDNVEKISAANKVGSAALFGVFAIGHVSKTFRCNNCSHKW